MGKALIIGCGGVANVTIRKCCQNSDVFEEIMIASRTKSKCDALKAKLEGGKTKIHTAQVDADYTDQLIPLIESFKPDVVINLALPYQDLTIMDACLATKTHYLDTANYEPKDTAKFEYKWQWAYKEKFEKAGIMALLGCGFDPGVTGVFTAYAQKHYFDEIHYIDILDCNGGDHGYAAISIDQYPRGYVQRQYWKTVVGWKRSLWKSNVRLSSNRRKNMYLLYHEELKPYERIKANHFFMTFGQTT